MCQGSVRSNSNESAVRFLVGQTKGKPVNIMGSGLKPGQSLFGPVGHVGIWSGQLVKWAGHPRVVKMDESKAV